LDVRGECGRRLCLRNLRQDGSQQHKPADAIPWRFATADHSELCNVCRHFQDPRWDSLNIVYTHAAKRARQTDHIIAVRQLVIAVSGRGIVIDCSASGA
jgi:hypothetical protein